MRNNDLIAGYRNKLLTLHATTVIFVSVLEIAAYVILHINGIHSLSFECTYLWGNVALPIFINMIIHLIARAIILNDKAKFEIKNTSIIFAALLTACVVAFFHREYDATACAFTFPLVLSGMFNDRRLLRSSFIVSVISLVAITLLKLFEEPVNSAFILKQAVIYGINIISYLSAMLAISFSDNSLEIIEDQANENKALKHIMRRDQMTGLYNHENFYAKLADAINDYHSGNLSFCLAMIDIDDFKMFNDTYGHDEGDEVLKNLASAMRSCCDSNDRLCRYGGEEFAIIFGNKSLDAAKTITENILSAFSNTRYDFTDKRTTFSAGIVEYNATYTNHEAFFDRADELMYKAKQNGKNQIITQ